MDVRGVRRASGVEPFLYGIKPAVIAVILGAVWRLGRPAVKDWRHGLLGAGVVAALLLGLGEVAGLLIGGLVGMLWFRASRQDGAGTAERYLPMLFLQAVTGHGSEGAAAVGGATLAGAVGVAGGAMVVSPAKVFLFFLKVGSVLYGSGYVLIAFLEGGLVADRGWLTRPELLDAVAIGQLTPGPVLSTATFIGYLLDGIPGAAVATIGIFLPSFVFVLLLNPLIPKLRIPPGWPRSSMRSTWPHSRSWSPSPSNWASPSSRPGRHG